MKQTEDPTQDLAGLTGRHRLVGLAAQFDAARGTELGTALIVSPFGVSADNMFLPAFTLASNGFRVVRFDPRNHVGRSEGDMYDFRISTTAEDVAAVLDAVRPDLVVGFSLAAPAVLRALAGRSDRIPAIMAAGVVNMRHTLKAVLETDFFDVRPSDHVSVLGEDVHGLNFIDDCRSFGAVEFADTVADGARISGPLTYVAGTEDPWVSYAEVEEFARVRTAGPTTVLPLPVGTHQFNLNPTIALSYTKAVLAECLRVVGSDEEGTIPPLHEAITARKRLAQSEAAGQVAR